MATFHTAKRTDENKSEQFCDQARAVRLSDILTITGGTGGGRNNHGKSVAPARILLNGDIAASRTTVSPLGLELSRPRLELGILSRI